jgi:hypothetical protein
LATFYNQEFSFATTAKDLLAKYPLTYQKDGYYMLYPSGRTGPGQVVYCDMTTDGGGWMMIARSHPSTVNYNGQNWGWRGGPIGSIKDFSQAYQAGWLTYWDSMGQTFTEFIFGNRSNIYNNSWGPFIYKRGITYTDFINSDTQQGGSTSTLKSDTNVYGTTSFPGMQGAIGYPVTGTSNNIYYMRDCCGFAGLGGTATSMATVYCGANFYYAGPWCGGSTTDGSGNFQNGSYDSNGLRFGGTNQYMIMVR